MKNKVLLILSLIFVASNIVFGQAAKKTITNDDLEKYRNTREKAESEYLKTYKERGMPSPEELVQREKESQRQREELSYKFALERQQNSNYFQIRANDLRNQIVSVDAQINYLGGQLGNIPSQNQVFLRPEQLNGVVFAPPYVNYGGNRGYRPQTNTVNIAPNVQAARNAAASMPNPYYGTPLYSTGVKSVIGSNGNFGRGGRRGGGYYGGYPIPYVADNNSYGRDELISRVQYLQQVRAGLLAQWNQLAEEAHRAGVRID